MNETDIIIPESLELVDSVHPYMHFRQSDIKKLRFKSKRTHKEIWKQIVKETEKHLYDPLPKIEKFKTYADRVNWREGLCDYLSRNAFVYLIENDRRFLIGAKKWTEYLCALKDNPRTYTHMELSHTLWGLSYVYDWLWSEFSQGEKERILESIQKRGTAGYKWLRKAGIHHAHGPYIAFGLGVAGAAFHSEIKDAEKWHRLGIKAYLAYFNREPEDGSALEGTYYWSKIGDCGIIISDILRGAFGYNKLFFHSWFSKAGYYKLYCALPFPNYSIGYGWTHSEEIVAPSMFRLADFFKNSYFQWYSLQSCKYSLTRTFVADGQNIFSFLWYNEKVKSKPPTALPLARLFKLHGLAAIHSTWRPDEIMVAFKCGRRNCFTRWQSHFELKAFGDYFFRGPR
jgi:hypothetical protein